MAQSTEMKFRLSRSNYLTEDESAMVEEATALMPLLEKVLDRHLTEVENKLDSEELFSLPAYNERMIDLIAQRRTLKKIKKLFEKN
jgi:hypothetical protein